MEFPMHGNFYAPYRCASQRNMEYERSLFSIVILFKGTWTLLCSSSLYLSKEHGIWTFSVPYRSTTQRNMDISLFRIALPLKGTLKFLYSSSLCLSAKHGNSMFLIIALLCLSKKHRIFHVPHRCFSRRNMKRFLILIVLLLKGTFKILCSSALCLSKEHGNFSAHYRLLLKWTWIFLFSISLFLSKEQWNFYGHYRLLLKWTWIFLFSISLFLYRNNEISMLINVLSLKVT